MSRTARGRNDVVNKPAAPVCRGCSVTPSDVEPESETEPKTEEAEAVPQQETINDE